LEFFDTEAVLEGEEGVFLRCEAEAEATTDAFLTIAAFFGEDFDLLFIEKKIGKKQEESDQGRAEREGRRENDKEERESERQKRQKRQNSEV
jgi:hypothetical protein